MKNLTEKEKDFITQQLAELFYKYFEKKNSKARIGNNLIEN